MQLGWMIDFQRKYIKMKVLILYNDIKCKYDVCQ